MPGTRKIYTARKHGKGEKRNSEDSYEYDNKKGKAPTNEWCIAHETTYLQLIPHPFFPFLLQKSIRADIVAYRIASFSLQCAFEFKVKLTNRGGEDFSLVMVKKPMRTKSFCG